MAVALALGASACGSSSSSDESTDTSAPAPPTTESVSTTAVPTGPVVAEDDLLVLADLGDPWIIYPESGPTSGTDEEARACSDGAGAPRDAAAAHSDIFQRGEGSKQFFRSSTWQFPDEAAATAVAAELASPTSQECERANYEARLRAAGNAESAVTIENATVGDGTTSYVGSFEIVQHFTTPDGVDAASAYEKLSIHRVGSTVVQIMAEVSASDADPTDPAAYEAIQVAARTERTAATDALMARLG